MSTCPHDEEPRLARGMCQRCYHRWWRGSKLTTEAPAPSVAHLRGNQSLHRHHRLRKDYGINGEDYDAMLAEQDGACAICGAESQASLDVDHDHDTGRVRGLLCRQCNVMLGFARDNATILRRAASYVGGR